MACANMQLLPRVCFCFLTLSGLTFGDRSGPGVTVIVSEGDDAILPCSLSTKESVVQKEFDWKKEGTVPRKNVFLYDAGIHYNNGLTGQDEQFKGRVSHFPEQLQFGNASIIIRNTRMSDSGDYTCAFPRLQSEETTNIKLVVEGGLKVRDVPGAAQPSVTNLDQTDDWALLQCDVRGAKPKPTVEWWDSDGQIISSEEPQVSERGGGFYITLITTVKKSGSYRCVATQEEIDHQTYKEINVYLSGPSTGWTAFIVLLAVVVVLLLVVVGIAAWRVRRYKKKLSAYRNGNLSTPGTSPPQELKPIANQNETV